MLNNRRVTICPDADLREACNLVGHRLGVNMTGSVVHERDLGDISEVLTGTKGPALSQRTATETESSASKSRNA